MRNLIIPLIAAGALVLSTDPVYAGRASARFRQHNEKENTMKRNTRTHQAPTLTLAAAATLAVLSAPANAQFAGFQRTDFPSPVAQPVHMALGDLDSDGDLDVAITNGSNVRIISNNGDGTLGETSFTSTSIGGGYIIIDDFDGINGLDMCIVARLTLGKFTILLNDGSGSFTELPSVSLGVAPFDGISGDFDGDGDMDLAIVSENLGEFTVAINDGAGGFTPLSPVTVDTFNPEDIAAADLDGDGDLDIAVMDRINNRLWLYTNDGSGGFTDAGISYPFSSGNRHTLTSVDINQDGLVDFLLSSGNVVSMLSAGDGSLVPQTPFPGLGSWAMSIFAPDLDGDGNLDVVVDDVSSTVFRYAFGIGDGTFAGATSNGASHFVSWVATGDMDGNGTPDVVVHTRNPGFIEVFINQTDVVAPGPFALTIPADGVTNLALPESITGWQINQPKFHWSTPTGFTVTYDLSVSAAGFEVYSAFGLTDPRHPVPSGILEPGIEYQWQVTAVNPIGSTVADAFTFTMALGPNSCPSDLDESGAVGVKDLLFLLGAWGPCP